MTFKWIVIALVFATACCSGLAPAQTPTDLSVDARRSQEDLIARSSVVLAAVSRQSSESIEAAYRKLNESIKVNSRLLSQADTEARQRRRLETENDRLRAERAQLLNRLESSDPVLQAAIDEYRRQIAPLINDPSAARQAALKRYADGDVSAIGELQEIVRADRKAREAGVLVAARRESAPQQRGVAALVLDAKNQGKQTAQQAIEASREAAELDPNDAWTWITLSRLYLEVDRVADAVAASENAVKVAKDPRLRAVSLTEVGTALQRAKDAVTSRKRFEQSLDGFERLAKANAEDAGAQRDVRVTKSRVGNLLLHTDDLDGAGALFLGLHRELSQLVKADPTNVVALEDLGTVLNSLGNIAMKASDLPTAKVYFEADLKIADGLAAARPSSTRRLNVAISLAQLADVQVLSGNLSVGFEQFRTSTRIFGELMGEDRGNVAVREAFDNGRQRFETVLERLGDLELLHQLSDDLAVLGEFPSAQNRAERTLSIAEQRARADPTSLEAQRLVSVSLAKLGQVLALANQLPAARARFEDSLKIARSLVELAPARYLDASRTLALVLLDVGKLQRLDGDVQGARTTLEESLRIAEGLALRRPTSVAIQRDLITIHVKLAGLPGGASHWAEALRVAEPLWRSGQFSDVQYDELRALARQQK